MVKKGLLLLAAVLVSVSAVRAQPVIFSDLPKDLQLYPRDTTNFARVVIEGEVTSPDYDAVVLKVYRDGNLFRELVIHVDPSGGPAPFRFTPEIAAELKNYDFEVYAKAGNDEQLVKRVEDVVAGDVFLIQGQSNAMARIRTGSTSANPENQGPFLRSFGTRPSDDDSEAENLTENDQNWHLAEGDAWEGPGAVGQWGLRLGRLLVDTYGIPIAILNGARGGQPISYYQRKDSDPDALGTNYGRLLFRAEKAGVSGGVRAILWYQGEAGEANLSLYRSSFDALYDDWKEDYPNVERVYTHQIRSSAPDECGNIPENEKLLLRDLQRRIPDFYSDVEVMSTTGVDAYDGCHFLYENGYEVVADNIFGQIARDLYGSSSTQNIDPPNVQSAFFSNANGMEITLRMQNANDGLIWENGAEADFVLVGTSETVTSGSASGNTVVLNLSGDASGATEIHYVGHRSSDGPWVTNTRGVGLLAFTETIESGDPLPVELVAFEAIVDGADVWLRWQTASERNNAGFAIEHAVGESPAFAEVAFVAGRGTTLEAQRYSYRLEELPYGRHRFRLKQVDHDGTFRYSSEIEVGVELPNDHALSAAYPNPFNPQTQFTLTVVTEQHVTVEVVDVLGRRVAQLYEGRLSAGEAHRFTIEGGSLASGVYLYRAVGETFIEAKQVVLVK